jgi:hypothetical protein
MSAMTSTESIALEVSDPTAAWAFYAAALDGSRHHDALDF